MVEPRYKPRSPEDKMASLKAKGSATPNNLISDAFNLRIPGTSGRPASHQEMMAYLCTVLTPALKDIVKRLEDKSSPKLSDDTIAVYCTIWGRTAKTVKDWRPRPIDAPLHLIADLLNRSRQISPLEVDRRKQAKRYKLNP